MPKQRAKKLSADGKVHASGAQKRKQRKQTAEAARRTRGKWNEKQWRAQYQAVGPRPADPERAHLWVASKLLVALEECCEDPGPAPEHRREQLARIGAQLAKVLEPAKLVAKLAEYEEALEELERKLSHGVSLDPGTDGAPGSPAPLQ